MALYFISYQHYYEKINTLSEIVVSSLSASYIYIQLWPTTSSCRRIRLRPTRSFIFLHVFEYCTIQYTSFPLPSNLCPFLSFALQFHSLHRSTNRGRGGGEINACVNHEIARICSSSCCRRTRTHASSSYVHTDATTTTMAIVFIWCVRCSRSSSILINIIFSLSDQWNISSSQTRCISCWIPRQLANCAVCFILKKRLL